ncbi:MAG: type II secretion system protein M [Rubrivivax sp.]|nr:type II secretion system protein M [Rubrivivax sp.]
MSTSLPRRGRNPARSNGLAERLQPLRERWSGLQERERRLLALGALVLGLAALWLLAIQPQLALLRQAPGRLEALDKQTQAMQRLAAETRELRAAPQVSASESVAALRAASDRLGPRAKLSIQGDRAALTVDGLDADSLRAWLGEVRSGARARAVDAQLSRGPNGFTGTISVALGGGS